ncbi:hypothetical protein [Streptomyces cyaneogriseus]|uniref:hypothetical protein n=1 Tax=Streptomyces cyaneogriseus TaxID=68192 RepID=UPI001331B170|nr:hypothetical protein [Streptomyces cyaneogriseus]
MIELAWITDPIAGPPTCLYDCPDWVVSGTATETGGSQPLTGVVIAPALRLLTESPVRRPHDRERYAGRSPGPAGARSPAPGGGGATVRKILVQRSVVSTKSARDGPSRGRYRVVTLNIECFLFEVDGVKL